VEWLVRPRRRRSSPPWCSLFCCCPPVLPSAHSEAFKSNQRQHHIGGAKEEEEEKGKRKGMFACRFASSSSWFVRVASPPCLSDFLSRPQLQSDLMEESKEVEKERIFLVGVFVRSVVRRSWWCVHVSCPSQSVCQSSSQLRFSSAQPRPDQSSATKLRASCCVTTMTSAGCVALKKRNGARKREERISESFVRSRPVVVITITASCVFVSFVSFATPAASSTLLFPPFFVCSCFPPLRCSQEDHLTPALSSTSTGERYFASMAVVAWRGVPPPASGITGIRFHPPRSCRQDRSAPLLLPLPLLSSASQPQAFKSVSRRARVCCSRQVWLGAHSFALTSINRILIESRVKTSSVRQQPSSRLSASVANHHHITRFQHTASHQQTLTAIALYQPPHPNRNPNRHPSRLAWCCVPPSPLSRLPPRSTSLRHRCSCVCVPPSPGHNTLQLVFPC
jgi:hypothetical protein